MHRPGGFPEFNPKQQAIWDKMLEIITDVFKKHNYEHIWTPAVEPIELLKKGGDIIEQQVYGLYGLAQGNEDTKDYALHFDLTIPLARYVLDHQQDIVFPFSRYQIQPVWRGESHKRGRYKEFWQCDIDTIRRSETNVWQWYDAQSIFVMQSAMKAVCEYFDIKINFIAKINHLNLTKSFLASLSITGDVQQKTLKLLDNYYKISAAAFKDKLSELVGLDNADRILRIIDSKDPTLLSYLPLYNELDQIIQSLQLLDVSFEYDICIVRGQNYYSGMVIEWFDKDDMDLGSLAAGGRYDKLTDFIDSKQSFSGVGASLGRFTALIMEKAEISNTTESYLFLNFPESSEKMVKLYQQFIQDNKTSEFYPTSAKFAKQLEYANKKNIKYAIICGEDEMKKGVYLQKDLTTGAQTEYPLSK
jgi:histidyl-tRNA synthetase